MRPFILRFSRPILPQERAVVTEPTGAAGVNAGRSAAPGRRVYDTLDTRIPRETTDDS
jgi:hypothetical protein